MFTRIRKAMDEREGGFTLIELLVVIIIIGILAAIAIPVFLRQREKGYRAAMKADLKNAATANESFATENNGSYVTPGAGVAALQAEGFVPSANVTVTVVDDNMTAAGGGFCLSAVHSQVAGVTYYYASSGAPGATNVGVPSTTACVAS